MKWTHVIALCALTIASTAHAGVGFLAEGVTGSGDSVQVSRPRTFFVKYWVNFDEASPTSGPGGCAVWLSPQEANYVGTVYQWAASKVSPQQFETVVELDSGQAVIVSRSLLSNVIETVLDDDSSPTGIGLECFIDYTPGEALWVGDWLIDAAAP